MPSLKTLINGRSDLPGPLCNVGAPRADDGDFKVYVVAAGKANHAGTGGWAGLTGNSSVWGLERENVGTTAEPWTPHRFEVACRVHAAFAIAEGRRSVIPVCRHQEWAPTRKIDSHTVTGNAIRDHTNQILTSYYNGGATPVPTPEDDDMKPFLAQLKNHGEVYLVAGDMSSKWHIQDPNALAGVQAILAVNGVATDVKVWDETDKLGAMLSQVPQLPHGTKLWDTYTGVRDLPTAIDAVGGRVIGTLENDLKNLGTASGGATPAQVKDSVLQALRDGTG